MPRKQSEPLKDVPRKRRKVIEDDDDDEEYAEGRSGELGCFKGDRRPETLIALVIVPTARRSQPLEVERLFDDDDDVDVTGNADDMHDRPPRSPSPGGSSFDHTNTSSRLQKRSAKAAFGEPPSRKRSKKKANVVYTDEEEDEYYEETGKGYRDDRDEDFVVDSPPQKKQSKKPATSVKGKGKGAKGKGDVKEKEIMVKDERKHVVQTTSAESATVNSKAPALGTKRRIEAISEKGSEDTIIASQSSSTSTLAVQSQSQSQPQDSRPPPQKKKLPTIKKNKTSLGAQAATQAAQLASKAGSANSAPAEAKTTLGSSLTPAFGVNLPKKPRTVPTIETADVDLSSPDVYASLFKTVSYAFQSQH